MIDDEVRARLLIDYLQTLRDLCETFSDEEIYESVRNTTKEIESLLIQKK